MSWYHVPGAVPPFKIYLFLFLKVSNGVYFLSDSLLQWPGLVQARARILQSSQSLRGAGAQLCGSSCAAFPGTSAGGWSGSREAGIPASTAVWDAGMADGGQLTVLP